MANRPELWNMPTPDAYANRSGARVRSAYDASVGAANRNMTRMGINPNSGRFAGTRAMLARDQAADVAGAQQQGYMQGQEANAQYSLQRDAAIRSWAQLALAKRNAAFSQRMAKKGFRLDQERHNLNMDRGRFDLSQAQTAAQRLDEAWNWRREDRDYETGTRAEDRQWLNETRGWARNDREFFAGDTGQSPTSDAADSKQTARSPLATSASAGPWRNPFAQESPLDAAPSISATRDADGNLVLTRPDGWTPPARTPQQPTAQRRGIPAPEYGGGQRGRDARAKEEDRAMARGLADRKMRMEDESLAVADLSESQQLMRYIEDNPEFSQEDGQAIVREYKALKEKMPQATETRLLLTAARNAGVNLGGFEAWKAEQMAGAKGAGKRSPLRSGGDMVKGQEGYWTSAAEKLGFAKAQLYDDKGGLTPLGSRFLDTVNAFAARAPDNTTEEQILRAAAEQVGMLTERQAEFVLPVRKLREEQRSLDPEKDAKRIAEIDGEILQRGIETLKALPNAEDQRALLGNLRELAQGDKKKTKQLDQIETVLKKRQAQRYFGEAQQAWGRMPEANRQQAVASIVGTGVPPHPDIAQWWEGSVLNEDDKRMIVYRVLSGQGTFAQAAEAIARKMQEPRLRRFKQPRIPTPGTVYDDAGDSHWDGSGN